MCIDCRYFASTTPNTNCHLNPAQDSVIHVTHSFYMIFLKFGGYPDSKLKSPRPFEDALMG